MKKHPQLKFRLESIGHDQGRPQPMRGPIQNSGAGPSEQWCYDAIMVSKPYYDLID